MDEFTAQLLKEKRQKMLLHQDAIYEKIHRKNMDFMGPLCKLWESLETAIKEQDSSVSINDLINFATQSIIPVGLTNLALSYQRCLSALDGVMKSTTQAKSMLKNKSEILHKENKGLFGKEFREQIPETVKVHKQSNKFLASAAFKDAASGNQPFRKDPRQANNIAGGKVLPQTTACKRAGTPTGIQTQW